MILRLDANACTGHGRCYALAPALFDADDDGHCVLVPAGDGPERELPEALEGLARKGAANCPEGALSIQP